MTMWTLRVTDDYITRWRGSIENECPLSLALQYLLAERGTPVPWITNANPTTGDIIYRTGYDSTINLTHNGSYYRIKPLNPIEHQAITTFISGVDHLELGQPYPRKHVFHYSNPEPYHL